MKKMSYIYFSLIVACFFSMSACVDHEDDLQGNSMEIILGAKVTSSVVSRNTTEFVDYDSQKELPITLVRWDEDDGDNVYGRNELEAQMGTPASDGTWFRNIEFTNNTQFYKDKSAMVGFAGWYPSSDDANWKKASDGKSVILDDYTMVYTMDGKTDVMISDFSSGTFQSGVPAMTFRHALCMFNIYAYAVDNQCQEEWGELERVSLSNLHKNLRISLPSSFTDEWNPQFSFFSETDADGNTDSQVYNLMDESQPVVLPVGFNNATKEGLVGTLLQGRPMTIGTQGESALMIEAKTSGQSETTKVAIVNDFKPGYSYNIYLKFSVKGIINADVVSTDWIYNGDKEFGISQDYGLLTDLSRYGTANCYIVSSANRGYCFDGTIKGNGVNTLTKRDGSVIRLPDTNVNLEVDSVVILRNDAMMELNSDGKMVPIEDYRKRVETPVIELLSDKLTDGKVIFRVLGNENDKNDFRLIYRGNVKIGAYRNGRIVWSWHIWVTDKPLNQGYSNGYVALDRNLGAVTKDYETFRQASSLWSGLYYQWGRKDPIFRPTVDEQPAWSDIWKKDVTPMAVPVSEAHAYPTTYFYNTRTKNWTTDVENNNHFWGYISIRDDVKKTLYDPCPPGYRVPGNALWENYSNDMTSRKVYNGDTFAGYEFTINGMIDIYYPNTVCLAAGELQNSDEVDETTIGDFTYMYSATPYEPSLYGQTDPKYNDLAYHFRYNDKIGTDYSSVLVADPDNYHVGRSAAYPVRCVFENSTPAVADLSEIQTANSYVVSRTGFYKFKANIRGNGVTGLNIVQKDGPTFYRSFDAGMGAGISGVDKVDLLWWQGDLSNNSSYRSFAESNPGSESVAQECPVVILDNGKLEDGYAIIHVTVNENTYGNVGLAAYDANGKILWSWHIWIQPEVKVVRLGDFSLMDRNLGATYAPESDTDFNSEKLYANLGLYYQWGRKDPFFPPNGTENNDNSTYFWFKKENGSWTKLSNNIIKSKQSLQKSVEEPNSYYTSDNTFWQTTYVDYKGEANDLWGYVGSAGDLGESFAKTMYDPCPPGYRVMQHNVFESANICNSNEQTTYDFQKVNKYGVFFKDGMSINGYVEAGGIWFPNSVAMDKDGNFIDHDNFRLSSATPYYSDLDGSLELNTREMRWWKKGGNYEIQQNHKNNWMMDGRVVRCQME